MVSGVAEALASDFFGVLADVSDFSDPPVDFDDSDDELAVASTFDSTFDSAFASAFFDDVLRLSVL